jgi:hypothetical protein
MDEAGLKAYTGAGSQTAEFKLEGKKMKNLPVLTIAIALCLGAAVATIQSGPTSNGWQSSGIQTADATNAPYREGLYLGKLAAARGGESRISTGRWATEADRASFQSGLSAGLRRELGAPHLQGKRELTPIYGEEGVWPCVNWGGRKSGLSALGQMRVLQPANFKFV